MVKSSHIDKWHKVNKYDYISKVKTEMSDRVIVTLSQQRNK